MFSNIGVDDRKESEKMVEYLISLGHKDIAIIVAEQEEKSIGMLRLEGYQDALRKHNIEINPALILPTEDGIGHFSMENGYRTAKKLIRGSLFSYGFILAIDLILSAIKSLIT